MKYSKIVAVLLLIYSLVVTQLGAIRAVASGDAMLPIIISDTFSIDGVNRTIGGQLNGSYVETGNVSWSTRNGPYTYPNAFVFAESNEEQYVRQTAADLLEATVPFEPEQNSQMSVEADVWPDSSSMGWMAIGFTNGEAEFWNDGQVWMNIKGNGLYEVYANKTLILIEQDTSSVFIPNAMNRLKLTYDSTLNTVSAWVNDERVVDHFSLESFVPDIKYVGFMVTAGDPNVQRIDNFIVKGIRTPLVDNELSVVISDSFEQSDIDRVEGFPLVGTATEVSGRRWVGNESIIFAGSDIDPYVTSHSNWGHSLVVVPYVPSGPAMSVEADVSVANSNGWMAIGFTKGTRELWYDGQVWMNLRPNGSVEVYVNAALNPIYQGVATDFNANGMNTMKIEYNVANHTVTAWVNSEKVADRVNLSGIAGFTPDIKYAGFVFQDPTPEGQKVKNFIIKGEMEPLPVPMAVPTNIVPLEQSDFPIGVFGNVTFGDRELFHDTIADLYNRGFDTFYAVNGSLNQDVLDFDIADAYGMGLYYNPQINLRYYMHNTTAADDSQKAQDIAKLLKARFEDHPSVRGVILSDEPQMNTMAKHILLADAIHEEIPELKVAAPVIGIGTVGEMHSAIDFDPFLIDVYPYSVKNDIGDMTMNAYGYPIFDFVEYIRIVTKSKPADQPLWIILQAHSFDSGGRFSNRLPIESELRMQNWLSIGEGATGIFWFLYETPVNGNVTGLQDHPELFDEASLLANRVKPLRETLLATKKDKDRFTAVATGEVAPYISTLVSKDDATTYVVAVNMDAENAQNLTVKTTQFEGTLKDLETGLEYAIGSSLIPLAAGDGKLFEVIPTKIHNVPATALTSPLQDEIYDETRPTIHLTVGAGIHTQRVEYFANGKLVGKSLQSPFAVDWVDVPSGAYNITAVATDSRGTSNSSEPVRITVHGTDNLLLNGSFEVVNANWIEEQLDQGVSLNYDSTVAHTGDKSIKLTGIATQPVLSQAVVLQPNTNYELSAWVKTEQIKGAGISIQFVQSGITTLVDPDPFPVFGTKDWTRVAVNFTTPAVVMPGRAEIIMSSLIEGGTAWIDDFSLIATGDKELIDSLEAHWTFDEDSGSTVLDYSSTSDSQKVGTIFGGYRVPGFLAGKVGVYSFYMNGGSEYIETPAMDFTNEQGYTIGAWIQLEEIRDRQIVYANGGFVLEVAAGGLLEAKFSKGDSLEQWSTIQGTQLKPGKWYHIAVAYEAGKGARLYINGAQINQLNDTAYVHDGSLADYIGGLPSEVGASLHGLIDDVRLYNRALSVEELTQLISPAAQALPGNNNGNNGNNNSIVVDRGDNANEYYEVTPNDLINVNEDGKAWIHIPSGVTEIIVPNNIFKWADVSQLGLVLDNATLLLPIEVLKQVADQVTPEVYGKSNIKIFINPLTDLEEKSLLTKGEASSQAQLKLAGGMYDFSIMLVTESGESFSLTVFDKPIMLTLKVNPSSNPLLVGLYYFAEDGTLEYIRGRYNNGEITAEINHFSVYAVLEFMKKFEDVSAKHWAIQAIQVLSAQHILNGVSASRFEPQRLITRAEFTAILVRTLNLKNSTEVTFKDVATDAWYAQAIATAVQAGIVSGRNSKIFDPDAAITRQEMVTMLMRAYRWLNDSQTERNQIEYFDDESQVAPWALEFVRTAAALKLIQGRTTGYFFPSGLTTRAEAAQVISNFLQLGM